MSERSGSTNPRQWTRRDVLRSAAVAPLAGGFLRWLPGGDERAIVVVELEGGNDGLNTLVPLADEAYAKARPSLGSVRGGAHDLGGGYGLHPALDGVHGLLKRGLGCAVHGVGYPDPDRSHFRSRDIWHTADVEFVARRASTTGWLGRAADVLGDAGAAVPGLSVGTLGVPLVLRGKRVVVPSLRRIEDYQFLVDPAGDADAQRRAAAFEVIERGGGSDAGAAIDFVRGVSRAAVDSAERLRGALSRYRAKAEYPEGELGRHMQLLARVLISGFGTRLLHLNYGGFDTHARQLPAHLGLLRELSGGLTALVSDLHAHGALDRVTILVHSEFGRRVAENQSRGTDHGAAGPAFVFGTDLAGTLLGEAPSLTDLQEGDLRATTDFRALYAQLLARIGVDPVAVLGREFGGVKLFA